MTELSFVKRKAWNGAIRDLNLSDWWVKAGKISGSTGHLKKQRACYQIV